GPASDRLSGWRRPDAPSALLEQPGRAAEMGLLGGDLGPDPLDLGLHLGDIGPELLDRQAVELAGCRGLLAGFQFLGVHLRLAYLPAAVAFSIVTPKSTPRNAGPALAGRST